MKFFSKNEWDPLEAVIVGSSFKNFNLTMDVSLAQFYRHIGYMYLSAQDSKHKPFYKKQYMEELEEDIEGFVDTLKQLHIKVYRPEDFKLKKISSTVWESYSTPPLNVRDQCIIIDDIIVETPPMVRGRYFENDYMKKIFYEHYLSGGNWLCMPRPLLKDESFDKEYVTDDKYLRVNIHEVKKLDDIKYDVNDINGLEMLIDGAQFARCNDDILVNIANRNHALALQWFKLNFPNKTFHVMRSVTDNHIDSYFVPLKEGVMLVRHEACIDLLPDKFKKWKIIEAPEPQDNNFPKYDILGGDIILTSRYIDTNVLSIDGDKIIVNALSPQLIKCLEQNGFTPIPVRHRHRRIFGGGFHCFTLDVKRKNV